MAGNREFKPARTSTASAPMTTSMPYTAGQTYKKGALVKYDSGQTIIECGADPAGVLGVSLEPAGFKPGYNLNFDALVNFRTGAVAETSIALANRLTTFSGRMLNGGTDPVTPAQTDVGVEYGVAKDSNGIWVVDQAEVTAKVVMIVDFDADSKIVFFKFREAVLQNP